MIRILPFVAKENCFALKGGTAINFFQRDMPRLSVDIDLTYLPLEERNTTLNNISNSLHKISDDIRKIFKNVHVQEKKNGALISKLFVRDHEGIQITIEPNEVIRGTVYQTRLMSTSKKVEEVFESSAEIQVLSIGDLYGGKLCAALDRQHPRDLFDAKILLENEGITDEIRTAFVLYLAGHDRPMHEVLNPNLKEFQEVYQNEFLGMTNIIVSYDELVSTREHIISIINKSLTVSEKQFLLSIKNGEPNWGLINVSHINLFPSINWKLLNIKKMAPKKKKEQFEKLKSILGM